MDQNSKKRRLTAPTSSSKNEPASGSSLNSSKKRSGSNPSSVANKYHGKDVLNDRLRSLLSHRLALPLYYAFNETDGRETKPLYRASVEIAVPNEGGDGGGDGLGNILEQAVTEWVRDCKDSLRTEKQLTKIMRQKIRDHEVCKSKHFHLPEKGTLLKTQESAQDKPGTGYSEFLFSDSTDEGGPSTPLALLEVGRNNQEWWKKLDQAWIYLDILSNDMSKEPLIFNDAVLCSALTIEGEDNGPTFQSQLGVFLCWPSNGKRSQIALLWNVRSSGLNEASQAFGRFLRVVCSFANWRKNNDANADYEYLSSSVCRFGTTVSWSRSCCLILSVSLQITLLISRLCFAFLVQINCNRSFGVTTVVFARQRGLRMFISKRDVKI